MEIKKDVGQAYLMMSTIGPDIASKDQFTCDIMATLLGSGESSRLFKKLKDELGLVYSIGFSFYTSKYEGMMFSFATLEPSNLAAVEEAVNEVLNEVREDGFTEQELQKAKNSIKTNHFVSMERGLDVADKYAQYDAMYTQEFVTNYPDNIANVTLAELNEAAQKYLNTDTYVKTTVVPK